MTKTSKRQTKYFHSKLLHKQIIRLRGHSSQQISSCLRNPNRVTTFIVNAYAALVFLPELNMQRNLWCWGLCDSDAISERQSVVVVCAPFLVKTTAGKPELTGAWPCTWQDFSATVTCFGLHLVGGIWLSLLVFPRLIICLCFFDSWCFFSPEECTWSIILVFYEKKTVNKGKPQSIMEKGYLELWELSTYQRHIKAKLVVWFSLTFYAEFFAPVLTVSLINSIKLVYFTAILYKTVRPTQWQLDSV